MDMAGVGPKQRIAISTGDAGSSQKLPGNTGVPGSPSQTGGSLAFPVDTGPGSSRPPKSPSQEKASLPRGESPVRPLQGAGADQLRAKVVLGTGKSSQTVMDEAAAGLPAALDKPVLIRSNLEPAQLDRMRTWKSPASPAGPMHAADPDEQVTRMGWRTTNTMNETRANEETLAHYDVVRCQDPRDCSPA